MRSGRCLTRNSSVVSCTRSFEGQGTGTSLTCEFLVDCSRLVYQNRSWPGMCFPPPVKGKFKVPKGIAATPSQAKRQEERLYPLQIYDPVMRCPPPISSFPPKIVSHRMPPWSFGRSQPVSSSPPMTLTGRKRCHSITSRGPSLSGLTSRRAYSPPILV